MKDYKKNFNNEEEILLYALCWKEVKRRSQTAKKNHPHLESKEVTEKLLELIDNVEEKIKNSMK